MLSYVLRYKARLGVALALALVGIGLELARPWPVKIVVDHVLANHPRPPWLLMITAGLPGADTPRGLLVWCVASAVVIVVGGACITLSVLKVGIVVCQRLVYDLSIDLFGKLQRLSLAYHSRNRVGDLLQRMGGDVTVVFLAVTQVALPAITSVLTLVGMFVIMASLDFKLSLIALAVVPVLAVSLACFSRPLKSRSARQWVRQGSLMSLVEQSLTGIKAIQGFAREAYIEEKVKDEAREFGRAGGTAMFTSAAYNQTTILITGVAAAVLLGVGTMRVFDGRLSVGDLLVFLGYLAALYGPVNGLAQAVGYGIAVAARSRRVFEIIDCQEVVPERADAVAVGRLRGEVVFENVTFGYEAPGGDGPAAARAVLRNISFRARPRQITAIVGATGAGKTSLVSLLSRFYDPWEGRILIDNYDVRDLTLKSLRENVSLVLQEPFLFPMSVAENIGFGRPEATREEIIRAARASHAHAFIERMPQGYDTIISEKGTTLSGGERQRIAIARAILKDAPVLVLDEPTSALDAHTEAQIFEALSLLMRDRTTFIISHRLSTIRRADQIIALEGGQIVERGTHESLIAAGNVYALLYERQHIAAM